jgi:hypothetical protein
MALVAQIERIRAYTRSNPELLRSHHFVYDLPLARSPNGYRFLVMGVNPGERLTDWERWPQPSEETSLFDFHAAATVRGAGSKRWRTSVEYFCGTPHVLMSEFFLWSSPNTHEAFVERFGVPIERSPHLSFCLEANLQLIASYDIEVVVAPGLKCLELFGDAYGLRHVRTINADNGHVLIRHYERDGKPWLFTKHWTASFGFSKAQKEIVRAYIAEVSLG